MMKAIFEAGADIHREQTFFMSNGAYNGYAKGNLISFVATLGWVDWMKFVFELDPTLDVNKPIKFSFTLEDNNQTPLMLSMFSINTQANFDMFKYLVEER